MSLRKLADVVIYRDDQWYSTFPSCIVRPDGTALVAFRRAPERRLWHGPGVTHADPNSWLMSVTSTDNGRTWSSEPHVVWANPIAGCQDPCMYQCADGTLLCTTFCWQLLPVGSGERFGELHVDCNGWPQMNTGVHIMRSRDGGGSWQGPVLIDPSPWVPTLSTGAPNRGAIRGKMLELPDGTLLLPVYGLRGRAKPSEASLYRSDDRGETWRHFSLMAEDDTVHFHEPALHRTPSGKIIAWLRTQNLDGYLATAYSTDEGKTFSQWERSSVWGHPFTSAATPDGRVLLIYGYRREPFGIRCRLLEPECTDLETAEEFVLRDDGANFDLGYPWVAQLADGKMLCVYYLNHDDGTRYIAGAIVEVG